MKSSLLFMAMIFSIPIFSQSVNVSTGVGFATVKKNDYRCMAIANNSGLSMEWRINKNWHVETGIALNNVRFNTLGSKLFIHEQLLQCPLSLKRYLPLGKHTAMSIQAGGYVYWLVRENSFNNESGTSVAGRGSLGNTTGCSFGLGFQTKVVRNWNFMAALISQQDLMASYPHPEDQLLVHSTLLQCGFQYRFFR